MPMSARCLYFTLNMFGDDDGFVNSPKAIMRQCGASEDDLKVLFGKKFILPFESGVIVIKHWRINNYLRNDRHTPTKYLDEMAMLKVDANGAYTMKSAEELAGGKNEVEQLPEPEKEERVFEESYQTIKKIYEENRDNLFDRGMLKTENVNLNDSSLYNLFVERVKQYGFNTVEAVVKKSVEDKFCIERDYILSIILSENVFAIIVQNLDKVESPSVCSKCGGELVDNSGGAKKIWYCMNCRGDYVLENGKWVFKQ